MVRPMQNGPLPRKGRIGDSAAPSAGGIAPFHSTNKDNNMLTKDQCRQMATEMRNLQTNIHDGGYVISNQIFYMGASGAVVGVKDL